MVDNSILKDLEKLAYQGAGGSPLPALKLDNVALSAGPTAILVTTTP